MVKRRIAILIFVMVSAMGTVGLCAQETLYKFDFGGGIGMSGYLGDANTSSLYKHPGFAAELGARYLRNARWAFRADLGLTSISGNSADMTNILPGGATYDFRATVFDMGLRAEFNFLPYGVGETFKKLRRLSPYLVLGMGFCVSSSGGETAFAPTLPMGIGVKYKIKPKLNFAAEFTMTKAFSDKIDGPVLNDLTGIKTSFVKNTDWYSRLMIGITYEFGERCATCHYVN